jgi:hypothetical protein
MMMRRALRSAQLTVPLRFSFSHPFFSRPEETERKNEAKSGGSGEGR